MNIIKHFINKSKSSSTSNSIQSDTVFQADPLSCNIQENINSINKKTGSSSDIVIRELTGGADNSVRIAVLYTEGLVDKEYIVDYVLENIAEGLKGNSLNQQNCFDALKGVDLPVASIKVIEKIDNLFTDLLSGETIILIDGFNQCLSITSKKWIDRGVQEPSSQTVVRGPKDGFTETLRTNTALIRRRIRDPNLWIETKQIGRRTKTDVAVAYIKGIANDKIIQELYTRLDKIDIDGILESGYIEELIQDEGFTVFPTVYNTERPDVVAAGLLSGRIAIIVDGTPFVLLIPVLFVQFFQASEDYYNRADISTLIRILRFICFMLALLVPATYVAITTFHPEMIPTTLLTSLASQREGVPFPAAVEALLMEVTFEVLREAGIRMPRAIGSAISIVGALVLGQAAVEAGIVSPIMVIIVSFTAICSFVSPSFNMAMSIRMLRFAFLLLAATFGLFGMALGLITMVLHLCSLRSFGIPYLYPMGPFNSEDQEDSVIRVNRRNMVTRPNLINKDDVVREGASLQKETQDKGDGQ